MVSSFVLKDQRAQASRISSRVTSAWRIHLRSSHWPQLRMRPFRSYLRHDFTGAERRSIRTPPVQHGKREPDFIRHQNASLRYILYSHVAPLIFRILQKLL